MSGFHPSLSKSLTSTPLKSSEDRRVYRSKSLDSDSTYSLLSPIYHDSFDCSDVEDHKVEQLQQRLDSSVALTDNAVPASPKRNEGHAPAQSSLDASMPLNLSAWEQWIVFKAKEERLRVQQKAKEEFKMKQEQKQEQKKQLQKKVFTESKVQEWLKMKSKQEKQERKRKEHKDQEKVELEEQKRKAAEQKAQEGYREWLQKKKQEDAERKQREKEEAATRETEEKERRKRAEEKFREWLQALSRNCPKRTSPGSPGYDILNYPEPSFYNPIPWKPIHVPQPEKTPGKSSTRKKQSGPPRYHSTPCVLFRPKDTLSFGCKRR
ncbi:coiled-coil domain-containing protein 34 [Denticeps clupeoides]|uniref:Coiled-coil domain-containing protein n=1 Tax=Denticeps clupeoides TaxID=299321 RepID=A0AAY4CX57_9TELE|nr:coiled-coil domain-containing protein 34 [Denticeps clupeoides]